MERPVDAQDQRSGSADVMDAANCWVTSFGTAPLASADAADLVEGALKVTEAVSRATRRLTWQTPDTLLDAMRRAEQRRRR